MKGAVSNHFSGLCSLSPSAALGLLTPSHPGFPEEGPALLSGSVLSSSVESGGGAEEEQGCSHCQAERQEGHGNPTQRPSSLCVWCAGAVETLTGECAQIAEG